MVNNFAYVTHEPEVAVSNFNGVFFETIDLKYVFRCYQKITACTSYW